MFFPVALQILDYSFFPLAKAIVKLLTVLVYHELLLGTSFNWRKIIHNNTDTFKHSDDFWFLKILFWVQSVFFWGSTKGTKESDLVSRLRPESTWLLKPSKGKGKTDPIFLPHKCFSEVGRQFSSLHDCARCEASGYAHCTGKGQEICLSFIWNYRLVKINCIAFFLFSGLSWLNKVLLRMMNKGGWNEERMWMLEFSFQGYDHELNVQKQWHYSSPS